MAAPHVCTVAAPYWSANLTKSNAQIRRILAATALDPGAAGRDDATGYGLAPGIHYVGQVL